MGFCIKLIGNQVPLLPNELWSKLLIDGSPLARMPPDPCMIPLQGALTTAPSSILQVLRFLMCFLWTRLHYTVIYSTLLYCTILYCLILYYTLLYYTILYCTVLYCTIFRFLTFRASSAQRKSGPAWGRPVADMLGLRRLLPQDLQHLW